MDDLATRFRAAYDRMMDDQPDPLEFDSLTDPIVRRPNTAPSPPWPRILVGATVAILVIVGAIWLGDRNTGLLDSPPTAPAEIELARGDVLWPPLDMAGTPVSVAEAFAAEVLGWEDASVAQGAGGRCLATEDENDPCSGTAVTIHQPGRDPLELLMVSIGGTEDTELWAVAQVGVGYPTDRLDTLPMGGSRIPLPPLERATSADVSIRLFEPNGTVTVSATTEDLSRGFVNSATTDPDQVLSVLLRYRNPSDQVVTAVGGPWDTGFEFPEPDRTSPVVEVARGTYVGSDLSWRLSAYKRADGSVCIELSGVSCMAPPEPDRHLSALSTTESEDRDGKRWCVFGPVQNAETVLLRPGAIHAPIYTHPTFDYGFFAYCAVGTAPPARVEAVDSEGNVLDVTPG